MSDPSQTRETSVTIKVPESKKYAGDAPWFVFRGSPQAVIEQIAETFGISSEGLTLADVTINAQRIATTLNTVAQGLGGTVISQGEQQSSGGESVFDQARVSGGSTPPRNTEEKPAVDPILAGIEQATSVAELQQHWAENQAAFNSNAAYMEAYKTKGKALSS